MPTYVTLLKFTDKGIQTIKESPKRVDAAKQMAKAGGSQITARKSSCKIFSYRWPTSLVDVVSSMVIDGPKMKRQSHESGLPCVGPRSSSKRCRRTRILGECNASGGAALCKSVLADPKTTRSGTHRPRL
jgi:hypothetical protein